MSKIVPANVLRWETIQKFKEQINEEIRKEHENGKFSASVKLQSMPEEIAESIEDIYIEAKYSISFSRDSTDGGTWFYIDWKNASKDEN